MAWVSKFGDDDRWPEEEPIVLPSTMVGLSNENSMAALPSSMDPMTGSTTTTSSTPLEAEDERLLELSKTDDLQKTLKASRKKVEKVEKPEWVVRPEEEGGRDDGEWNGNGDDDNGNGDDDNGNGDDDNGNGDDDNGNGDDDNGNGDDDNGNGDDDSNCYDNDGFAIPCTGDTDPPDPNDSTMAKWISRMTRNRKLAEFDMWGGAPEWGEGEGYEATNVGTILGLTNLALSQDVVQEMVGLPQSYKTQIEELGNLTANDIAIMNKSDREMLGGLVSGALNWLVEHTQGRVETWATGLVQGFRRYGNAPAATDAQVESWFQNVMDSAVGAGVLANPQYAIDKLGELHSEGVARQWPERESYGELQRQQNPLYQWG
jgi:hypothetical protein